MVAKAAGCKPGAEPFAAGEVRVHNRYRHRPADMVTPRGPDRLGSLAGLNSLELAERGRLLS